MSRSPSHTCTRYGTARSRDRCTEKRIAIFVESSDSRAIVQQLALLIGTQVHQVGSSEPGHPAAPYDFRAAARP
jgi:hypothetical protein